MLLAWALPLPGIEIEGRPDGSIVRSESPRFGNELENALGDTTGGAFRVTRLTRTSWRVDLAPSQTDQLGPGKKLELGAYIQEMLRTVLRDPLDLDSEVVGAGVDVTVVEPEHHRAFVEALSRQFAGNADFMLRSQSSSVVRLSKRDARPGGPSLNAAGFPPFAEAAAELDELASRPVVITLQNAGLAVRAKYPSENSDWAAVIRRTFADSPDIAVAAQPDHSLLISFTSALPTMAPVGEERLTRAVQGRLNALGLSSFKLRAIVPDKVEVDFSTTADVETFARGLANGFAMRMVTGDASDGKGLPPAAGDERLPQREGGYLWLSPISVLSGDMIAEAWARPSEETGMEQVAFRLTDEGQKRLSAVTGANIGRQFAIVVDGVVVSAPMIAAQISGAEGEIAGGFTPAAAASLAKSMLSHRDDLPLRIVD